MSILVSMRVSVVVPAFNEEKIIAQSLAAMREACSAWEARGWEWELIVCNNNSTDRTGELALAAGARVVFEPVNQIARARNSGAAAATGDWLVFVDADSFPTERLFAKVADRIEEGRWIGGGCLVTMEEMPSAGRVLLGVWNWLSRITRWAAGSFVFCEAKVFRELGGFSENLYASEEVDFSQRLKKAGKRYGRRMTIITEERLSTSPRKLHLYSRREQVAMFRRAIFSSEEVCGEPAGVWVLV